MSGPLAQLTDREKDLFKFLVGIEAVKRSIEFTLSELPPEAIIEHKLLSLKIGAIEAHYQKAQTAFRTLVWKHHKLTGDLICDGENLYLNKGLEN